MAESEIKRQLFSVAKEEDVDRDQLGEALRELQKQGIKLTHWQQAWQQTTYETQGMKDLAVLVPEGLVDLAKILSTHSSKTTSGATAANRNRSQTTAAAATPPETRAEAAAAQPPVPRMLQAFLERPLGRQQKQPRSGWKLTHRSPTPPRTAASWPWVWCESCWCCHAGARGSLACWQSPTGWQAFRICCPSLSPCCWPSALRRLASPKKTHHHPYWYCCLLLCVSGCLLTWQLDCCWGRRRERAQGASCPTHPSTVPPC